MKSISKLLLPVAVAIVAFIGNQTYLTRSLPSTRSYVKVKKALSADGKAVFTPSQLEEVKLQVVGDAHAELAAVPWADVKMLLGAPVTRDLRPNDLVLLSDLGGKKRDLALQPDETALLIPLGQVKVEPELLKVGRYVGFVVETPRSAEAAAKTIRKDEQHEQLGPFRIVSVGSTIEQETAAKEPPAARNASTISVATKLRDGRYLNAAAGRLLDASRSDAIRAITLYRFDEKFTAASETIGK